MLGFLAGALLAAVIAAAALRLRALTPDGAIAAFIVGACTFGAGGLAGAAVLLAFFVTSLALTRAGRAKKRTLGDVAKGGPRDAFQVVANGGIATLCVVLAASGDHAWSLAFAGAYAAANADTWGTEIGTLIARAPRSIVDARPLATGLSGGITLAGSLAEVAGAALIALVALASGIATDYRSAAVIAVAGTLGAFADSVLGATLQERRWCRACQRVCENDPHACGTPTTHHSGLAWFSNDVVNVAATFVGATLTYALA